MSHPNIVLSLDSSYKLVSLESLDGRHQNASNPLIMNLHNFLDVSKSMSFSFKKTLASLNFLGFRPDGKAMAFVKSKNYSEIREIPINIPQGLDVPFIQYCPTIEKLLVLAEDIDNKVLSPAIAFIGEYLSNPELLNSVNGNTSLRNVNFREKQIAEVKQEVNRAIKDSKTEPMGRYGDYFERNDDYVKVQVFTNAFGKRLDNLTDPANIADLVDELVKRIELLQLRIESEPETYKMAKGVAGHIANVVYAVAKEVEFYAASRTMITIFINTMKTNNEMLAKLR